MTLSFDVLAKPIGKGRPRFTRRGHAYTPAKTRQYERLVATVALAARQEWEHEHAISWPLDATYRLSCEVMGAHGNTDVDNCAKLLSDSLQGVLFGNDRQVHEMHAVKSTEAGAVPRLRVTVETL